MKIERSTDGVIDFLMGQIEDLQDRNDMEYEKKLKQMDMLLKHVWNGARLNMQHKQLTMRAPEIAKNKAVVLSLGSQQLDVVETPAKTEKTA